MTTRSKRQCEGSQLAGRVTLVGAGPGDPELLTIQAIRAMQEADVILFDALVSQDILAFAQTTAKRMLVGKRGHRPSCKQDDINTLMVKLAHQGKHVVRLKSGDPSLFGRAGEEIAFLIAAGIPVSIIPGVTSASAMAAALKVSLTHRNKAQSVRFLTGHGKDGGLPEELDWKGLADPAATLVIYMGGRTGFVIAARLISLGLSPSTPCVVARSISRPGETAQAGTLRELAANRLGTSGDEPVLIGIGRVFEDAVAQRTSAPHPDAEWPESTALNLGLVKA